MGANSEIIDPSTFNRRITVRRVVPVVGSGGGISNQSEDTRFETWASVDSLSSSRKVYLGFDAFDNVYEIKLRRTVDRDFIVADLVDYENSVLQVMSVQLVRQSFKFFNILIVKEVVPQG